MTSRTGPRWGRAILLALLLSMVASAAYFGLRAAWSDAITLRTRHKIEQWQTSRYRPSIEEWREARDTLLDGLRHSPDDAKLSEHLGYLYGMRAEQARRLPELYHPLLAQASIYYVEALRLRPMSPHIWANIALAGHLMGDRDQLVWQAFDRAMAYGANEPQVQMILAEIGLSRWSTLDETHRQSLRASFERAAPALRKQLDTLAARHQIALFPAAP